jgi:hypothetical protein
MSRESHSSGGQGARSCCLGAQGKHLRLLLYGLGCTEGLKAIPRIEDGFDVLATVLAHFPSPPEDVHVQRARADLVVVAPHTQQQGFANVRFWKR